MDSAETQRIGIAGYMGSGKSTLAGMLEEYGAIVIDADSVARELMREHEGIKNGIRHVFGDEVFQGSAVDFSRLGKIVFGDTTQLDMLNGIVHPPLLVKLRKLLGDKDGGNVKVLDAALISFWGIENWFDSLLWVHASRNVRCARLIALRGWSQEEARMRIVSQEELFSKPTGGNWRVVVNEVDVENLRDTIEEEIIDR